MATRHASTFEKKFKPQWKSLGGPYDRSYIEASDFEYFPERAQYLWTLIDPMVPSGMQYWIPGYHYVNRVGYIYTEIPWTEADLADEYRRW